VASSAGQPEQLGQRAAGKRACGSGAGLQVDSDLPTCCRLAIGSSLVALPLGSANRGSAIQAGQGYAALVAAREEAGMYVTFFGDRRGTLPSGWTKETIVALVGDARIDATAPAGPGATLTFLGLAGDAVVRVSPGSRVSGGGLSVFGDRKIEVSPGDGPEIRIDGFSLFGDVEVSDRPSV
jgi:hypothetical protein